MESNWNIHFYIILQSFQKFLKTRVATTYILPLSLMSHSKITTELITFNYLCNLVAKRGKNGFTRLKRKWTRKQKGVNKTLHSGWNRKRRSRKGQKEMLGHFFNLLKMSMSAIMLLFLKMSKIVLLLLKMSKILLLLLKMSKIMLLLLKMSTIVLLRLKMSKIMLLLLKLSRIKLL